MKSDPQWFVDLQREYATWSRGQKSFEECFDWWKQKAMNLAARVEQLEAQLADREKGGSLD